MPLRPLANRPYRIGIVFVFQDKVTRLLSWNVPVHTWSFLAVYTFCCLNPNLLIAFPLAALLSFVMVPAFLTRHPSPPDSLSVDTYPLEGPASAPAPTIKPAPEMSKDFFRNMRDLQNCMEDFSVVHDAVIDLVAPPTNFSDEKLSTAIFLITFLSACVLLLTANSIPWRFAFLAGGWAAILSAHPEVSSFIMSLDFSSLSKHRERLQRASREWINADVILDEVPETRQVEVFELQHRNTAGQWELWVYGPSPYHPLSPIRLAGERPKGTRFFEDVQAPKGWEWSEKKWMLDPLSKEWVDERMVTVVEVETDGERWVYDLSAGDVDVETRSADTAVGAPQVEYDDTSAGQKLKGEWRRRRWIRLVRRKVAKSKSRVAK